jgi:cell division protein FtsI (penicillin-binding protein 3)
MGTIIPFEKTIPKQVLKPETTKTVTNMLVHVYENYNNGAYKMEHYSIAAKTGTAQIAKEGGGGYEEGKHTHSFFAFFPASKPKFLVFYTLRDPRGVSFASQTLIGPFTELSKYLIHYYELPPDR